MTGVVLDEASKLLGRHAPALKRLVPPKQRQKAWSVVFKAMPTSGKTATFARWFRTTADQCGRQGSPLYQYLLDVAADDIERRGPTWQVVEAFARQRSAPPAATALAFMAAVHQVVLDTPGNRLERYYPSVGGTADQRHCATAFLSVVAENRDRIRQLLTRTVQTNEVARSRVLVGGFLLVAQATGLPLRLVELGSSAGLNLRWDHYRYEAGDATWGDPASPVRLTGEFLEGTPPFHLQATVAERMGCDLSPIDARSAAGQMRLLSHVWADQTTRVEQLRAAFAVAERVDAPIVQGDAAQWIKGALAAPVPGLATVVFDTCVMEYLPVSARADIRSTIQRAGSRATADAPLAWLHLGPGADGGDEELTLSMWPEATTTLLATCDPYGRRVRWLGPAG